MSAKRYTPYDDVNEILDTLLKEVKRILVGDLIGMYLFGSLANGDFDRDSDIDVLIVTKDDTSNEVFSRLHAMHQRIAKIDSPWAVQLEVSYIPQNALRSYDPYNNRHPHLDRDRGEALHIMRHDSDWIIQRYILRERGVVIAGPDPKTLINPVASDNLRQAVVDVLPLWINPILEDPSQIKRRGYQSFFILSLCRMLYTYQYGEIVSKPIAAQWAKENLDKHWIPLIERAWIGRKNPGLDAQPEDIDGTLDMMRYTLQQIRPTPYPAVNGVLNQLRSKVKKILGELFVGMYLYGSLASGDFDPKSSDIDFVVVTEGILPDDTVSRLDSMHQEIWSSGLKWASKLEGSYIPKDLIRRHDPNGPPCPTVNEGKFFVDHCGSDWIIQRHVIREYGVVLEGPDPKSLIDPVSPNEIRQSVRGILEEWWFPMLENHAWLAERGSEYHAFAVLTMCRSLHALQHGTIVSKPVAAKWAREEFDGWGSLIEKALLAQHGKGDGFLGEALDLIQFTKNRIIKQEVI